ncbi:endoglucanase [Actinoplanes sp. SE50]|uniref:glycoside hydrolase family 6 protein n=1 Tax=unclassified Actinoplanes TaxID=2626549 RepID=UPI00023EC838|nr:MULTISPECIES: glycoside hydrolase family 6 protein [unclassified Actinoplanes]AEV86464.1 putative secreted endoglucanase [Actinoplanes sp. SE50/110]ATO84862.1 endoglucanase [Actinoplanes sp. SE50]SLM02271.1 endoglucanase [Actinoplanes sp. SE50/110]
MRVRSTVLTGLTCLSLAACTAGAGPGPAPAPVVSTEPAEQFYVDPSGAAEAQVRSWNAQGRAADATAVRRIADQPAAVWFADADPGFAGRARDLVTAAAAAGRTPVLVAYYVPQRDCGGHSGGGAPDAAAYRDWIGQLAGAVHDSPALVVLEPDAVTHILQGCLSPEAAGERFALLGEAIHAFRADPGVRVYLDAGNPGWVKDVDRVVDALRSAGIADADGFSLNVANFETTQANLDYGTSISDRLGGTHFVIDTSRNGNGPATTATSGDGHWCNPPGRALGPAPTTRTGHDRVDAYLWVKRPGESDGACGDGAPPAGQWWPEYALSLATN